MVLRTLQGSTGPRALQYPNSEAVWFVWECPDIVPTVLCILRTILEVRFCTGPLHNYLRMYTRGRSVLFWRTESVCLSFVKSLLHLLSRFVITGPYRRMRRCGCHVLVGFKAFRHTNLTWTLTGSQKKTLSLCKEQQVNKYFGILDPRN